jgi:hypothetical protein
LEKIPLPKQVPFEIAWLQGNDSDKIEHVWKPSEPKENKNTTIHSGCLLNEEYRKMCFCRTQTGRNYATESCIYQSCSGAGILPCEVCESPIIMLSAIPQ